MRMYWTQERKEKVLAILRTYKDDSSRGRMGRLFKKVWPDSAPTTAYMRWRNPVWEKTLKEKGFSNFIINPNPGYFANLCKQPNILKEIFQEIMKFPHNLQAGFESAAKLLQRSGMPVTYHSIRNSWYDKESELYQYRMKDADDVVTAGGHVVLFHYKVLRRNNKREIPDSEHLLEY